jgi:hypothetical protein
MIFLGNNIQCPNCSNTMQESKSMESIVTIVQHVKKYG